MYSRDKIIQTMREIVEDSKSIAPYVVVAQPRRVEGETPAQVFKNAERLPVHFIGHSWGFIDIYGEKVDVARNYLIEQVIESGAKYMLFIGEDTVMPYDGFATLHRTAEENPGTVVVGVYYVKLSEAMIMVRKNNWIEVPNVDPGQIFEAEMVGMDAMLIPVDILRKMKEKDPDLPFCCIGHKIEDLPFIGEDNFFIHRLRKMGVKILVNTDVQCLHVDLELGKYTAHPSINEEDYLVDIPLNGRLTKADKKTIDRRWVDRLPKGTGAQE